MLLSSNLWKNYLLHERVGRVIFVSSHLLYPPAILFISISLLITRHNPPAVYYPDSCFESGTEDEAAFTVWCWFANWMLVARQQVWKIALFLPKTSPLQVRLCCYLQSNFTQGPQAKLALYTHTRTHTHMDTNTASHWAMIIGAFAFSRIQGFLSSLYRAQQNYFVQWVVYIV